MLRKLLDFTALLFYCSLIYLLSAQPSIPMPMLFIHQDKLHHFGAYFVMGILAWRCSVHLQCNSAIKLFAAFGFCSLYGAADEWHQSFVPGRDADWVDWLADTVGVLSALIFLIKRNATNETKWTSRL